MHVGEAGIASCFPAPANGQCTADDMAAEGDDDDDTDASLTCRLCIRLGVMGIEAPTDAQAMAATTACMPAEEEPAKASGATELAASLLLVAVPAIVAQL